MFSDSPFVEGSFAEPVLAAEFFQGNTGFRFLQNAHNLAFGELALLHVDHYLANSATSFPLINGTILGEGYLKTHNRAAQALRMAAGSVMRAACAFGAFYRRQKARLGPAQAAVATAQLIARVVYRMLKYKVEYEPLSVVAYEQHYREQ